jgi:uncharacterized protein (TIGR02271 family)
MAPTTIEAVPTATAKSDAWRAVQLCGRSPRSMRAHLMERTQEPEDGMTLHGEELHIEARSVDAGVARVEKTVTTHPTAAAVDRRVEGFEQLERVAPHEGDSGEIERLADGSISVPILEEQLVVTKRIVVIERVIVRKRTTIERQVIEADLRSEHVSVDHPAQDA